MRENLNSFTNGIVSPYISARNDLDKHGVSCEKLENFINLPYGAAQRRNGLLYIRDLTTFSTYNGQLYDPVGGRFKFSNSEVYVLIFGHNKIYIRDANDVASILDSVPKVDTIIYESDSGQDIPWDYDELDEIKIRQSADVLYIVHPNYAPRKLSRTGSATTGYTFTCTAIQFVGGPFEDYNADTAKTVTIATGAAFVPTGTSVTVTSAGDVFEDVLVGDYISWRTSRDKDVASPASIGDIPLTMVLNSGATASQVIQYVKGAWDIETSDTWTGTITVAVNANPTGASGTWKTIFELTSVDDKNYIKNYESLDYEAIRFTFDSANNARIDFNGNSEMQSTLLVTAKVGPNSVTCKAMSPIYSDLASATETTSDWAYSSWSAVNGFPSALEFHEQRLWFASTVQAPNVIWGSEVANFETFDTEPYYLNDSSSVSYSLSGGDVVDIKWLISQRVLLAGTDGGNFVITGAGINEPISPTSINVRRQDNVASGEFDGSIAGDTVIYAQSNGKKIRAAIYQDVSDGYVSEDLNLANNEILIEGVVDYTYQQIPEPYIWVVCGDGNLYGLSYNRVQSIFGWTKFTTDGSFKSIVATPTLSDDRLWGVVYRNIGGNKKIYLERFYLTSSTALKYAVQSDCSAIVSVDGTEIDETIWSIA